MDKTEFGQTHSGPTHRGTLSIPITAQPKACRTRFRRVRHGLTYTSNTWLASCRLATYTGKSSPKISLCVRTATSGRLLSPDKWQSTNTLPPKQPLLSGRQERLSFGLGKCPLKDKIKNRKKNVHLSSNITILLSNPLSEASDHQYDIRQYRQVTFGLSMAQIYYLRNLVIRSTH